MTTQPHDTAAKGLSRIEPSSLREATANEIRRAIVTGNLTQGTKLTEASLVDELGVSRSTVREALTQLVRDGWVEQIPYAGMRVASLNANNFRDVVELRTTLDRLALRAIYADATGARLKLVTRAWEQLEHDAHSDDALVRHDAHIAFHRALWEASQNEMLIRLWPAIEANMSLAIAGDQLAHPDPDRTHRNHKHLYEEIASGDVMRAHRALLEHIVEDQDLLKEVSELVFEDSQAMKESK